MPREAKTRNTGSTTGKENSETTENQNYEKASVEKIIKGLKIPEGSKIVFKSGHSAHLKKNDAPGIIAKNYFNFIHPKTNRECSVGVTGPYITDHLGNDIKDLDHFLVPAKKDPQIALFN